MLRPEATPATTTAPAELLGILPPATPTKGVGELVWQRTTLLTRPVVVSTHTAAPAGIVDPVGAHVKVKGFEHRPG